MREFIINLWGKLVAWMFQNGATSRARFFAKKTADFLPFSQGTEWPSLLDLGCGTGHIGLVLQKQYRQRITLVDVKAHLGYVGEWLFGLPCARQISKQYKIPLQLYDGRKLPFADGSFDTVLLVSALHHADNPDEVLREAARVAQTQIKSFGKTPQRPNEKNGRTVEPTYW